MVTILREADQRPVPEVARKRGVNAQTIYVWRKHCASLFLPMEIDALDPIAKSDTLPAPRPKAPPIESRFLFVDVAAMRAKQLRRGALPRMDDDPHSSEPHRPDPHKAERIAMEEVRRGLVLYEVPVTKQTG